MVRVFGRQRRGIAAFTAIVLVMTLLAVFHRGVPAADVELNDGGVWVTNQARRLVAHLNYPSRTLDGGLHASSASFDVTQHANTVLLRDAGVKKAAAVDTAALVLDDGAALPETLSFSHRGTVAAISDASAGSVWTMDADQIGSFSAESEPTLKDLVGVRTVVGVDGVVHLVMPDGSVKRLVDSVAKDDGRIEGIADLATASLSVVGGTVVVLDKASSTVRTPRGTAQLPAGTFVVQEPGPDNDRVVLAGTDRYVWVRLAGGEPVTVPVGGGTGQPAAPVYLGTCAYLAWAGSGAYVRDCANDADDQSRSVDRIKTSTQLAFRANRDVIVLNDLANGMVLLVNDEMRHVDNWEAIDSAAKEQENEDAPTTETTDELAPDTKKDQQTRPEARDDEYGVRPGRSFTLPVLENDTDADGDLLTAAVKSQPNGAVVAPVRGGEALSIAVPADATGPFTFGYTADDGRGGTADASVTVTVFPGSQNEAPTQHRTHTLTLGGGGEAAYAMLGDFRDPEGDSIYLASVVEQPPGLSVKFRPDGVVTVKDLGTGGPGQKKVTVSISDGVGAANGVLMVDVKDRALPPVANADHVTALKGQDVVVRPLANDVDPNGDRLRLSSVPQAAAGQTITPDYANGTFTFASSTPGIYYLAYQVVNEASTPGEGSVRVDVVEPAEGPPVTTDDLATLATGGAVHLDVMANDSDPAGGVLVLKSVEVDPEVGLGVEIVEHSRLRVSAPTGLAGPTHFAYTVSNGLRDAVGRVTVISLPHSASVTPPNAHDDATVVRVGDIVTVPVLANDQSPSGLALELDPTVTIEGDETAGDAFVSRTSVRFRAKKPGVVRVNYTVRDTAGNFATAQVVVTATPIDAATNARPLPQPLIGRVLAGGTTTIPVVLDGIDPDGDSTTLVGLGSPPLKGTAQVSGTTIEYTAPANAHGTDTFTYEVADRFGAAMTATVRVGIGSANTANQSPVALLDDVATRPGRALTIDPVANDMDADGDTLSLVADSVTPTDTMTTVVATASDGLLELKTPDEETTLRYYYGVTDGRGGSAKGVASVTVSKDAVLRPPVALDDVVTTAQIRDAATVEVDVLANDFDPDGSVKDLDVASDDAGASVTGGKVTVTVTEERQVVLYSVTDVDGLVGRAAIVVPPKDNAAPYLDLRNLPLRVKAGQVLPIPIADHVVVRQGRTPLLTFATKARAGAGADTLDPVKDARTLQFQSLPDFVGLSSVTFEVTDGASPDDPTGRKATLSIPIIVEPNPDARHQPVLTPSQVTVAAGESATADLRQMVSDEDPGDKAKLTFSLGGVSGGITANLDGSTLRVSAPETAVPGSAGTVVVTVSDGSTEPVTGSLKVTVTASTRPLVSTRTAVVNDARAGSPSTIDLSSYVTNPFAAEGKPLTIMDSPAVTGTTGAKTSVNGMAVTVTPPAGFHGQLVVTYTVQDATRAASRQVQGTIQLTVRDRPDAPMAVTAETHLSRTVTVSWTAGANNGSPITGFTVYWAGGSKACGAATNCLITGLTNNTTYTFTVTATNAVGESERSEASNAVRPDVKPNPPAAVTAEWGDKQVTLTWAVPTSEGSPVTSYTVSGPGGTREVTGTSYTWTGLTNGTSYSFRVQSHNASPDPSDWSAPSPAVVPAGVPLGAGAPVATKNPVSALQPSATLAWPAPNGNGDSNLMYEVRHVGTGAVVYSGSQRTASVTLAEGTAAHTYQVRAQNKAGWSAWSGSSSGVRGWRTPGPVTGLTVAATGANNRVTITFGAADGNGAAASEVKYFWSANGVTQSIAAGGGTVTNATAFPNGQNTPVAVYAVSTVDGESSQGSSTSATVVAYGPPTSPTMSCSASGTSITCSWSGGNANGRTTSFVVSGGWASANGGASGSHAFGSVGYSTTRTLCVRATQDGGAQGANNCANATTQAAPPPPKPSVSVSKGARMNSADCASSTCAYVVVTTANFSGNVSCTLAATGYAWANGWTQGPNQSLQTGKFYGHPGNTVTATCNGVSGSMTWS